MADMLFVTAEGIEVPLRPISVQQLELVRLKATEEAEEKFGKPLRPTYTEEVFGGGTEVHEHNETTLETDEERAAWESYQEHLTKFNGHVNGRVMDYVLLAGTRLELPEDTGWMELQAHFGLAIPENKFDLRAHWLKTEVIKTLDDIQGIGNKILEISGIDDRLKQAAVNSFPDTVEQPGGAEPG